MEAIVVFLSSFFGSISAYSLYRYITSSSGQSAVLKPLQRLAQKVNPPKGEVLHSPTPEEEEKEEWRKFEKLVEEKRQKMGITEDYRKV